MRISIIREDGLVNIDGEAYGDLDLSFMDSNIHAVQWYDDQGEIEWKTPHPYKLIIERNEHFTDLTQFQLALDLWQEAKAKKAELLAASNALTPPQGPPNV